MKFLFALSGVVIIFILVVFSLGSWLDYDQMLGCSATPTASGDCEKADVIVAISGGDTSVRTAKTVELYKDGFADNLIFSGAAADPSSPSNAKVMAVDAEKAGVPSDAIILDETSRNTSENAANVAKILKEHGWTNVILVSEDYHLRRAYTDFVKADTQASFRTTAAKSQPLWWITPRGWILIAEEIGGMTKTAAGGQN